MKAKLLSLCIVLCSLGGFLPVGVAQAQRPIVRLIYFLPRDRHAQPDIDQKLGTLIKDVQQGYAGIMEAHGFGRKTFIFETDARGNAVVHHIVGDFTNEHYSEAPWSPVLSEIEEHFNPSENIYLIFLDVQGPSFCGLGASWGNFGGVALIPASGGCFTINHAAHELGHGFGLGHDDLARGNRHFSSGISDLMVTSFCAAEWLDAHRAFNASDTAVNKNEISVQMLGASRVSASNAIRFRFQVNSRNRLHQAQLEAYSPFLEMRLIGCQRLNDSRTTTFEFLTPQLAPISQKVRLRLIDVHGNMSSSQEFPINVTSLLPPAKVIRIPDANLAAAVQEALNLSPDRPLTTHTLLNLGKLDAFDRGITDLTGLERALNLQELYLDGNQVSDLRPLKRLKNLRSLYLNRNQVSDLRPLKELMELQHVGLSDNNVSDVSALFGNRGLQNLYLWNNPLSSTAINTQIPELQAKGIQVYSDGQNTDLDAPLPATVNIDASVDVLIYTGSVWWIHHSEAITEAKTTKRLLKSAGTQTEITNSENAVKQWMLQTTSNGSVDVLILYGDTPNTIYPAGNVQPDGSVAENWIETSDGNTILNHGDWIFWGGGNAKNREQGLQNMMDIPGITMWGDTPMRVTATGSELTPSLVGFQSNRPFHLDALQGEWFAEKVFASDTGDENATRADPVIVRDGNRGRIAIVHQTEFGNNPKGEVAAEIVINYLLADAEPAIAAAPAVSRVLPTMTCLLPNYPNPFNPETWIPYQLREPANVKISIYNAHGVVVRRLALGHQPAGIYTSRSRAAYWDGCNTHGEPVASGVYFYTLTTGDFTSTRKMLIRK